MSAEIQITGDSPEEATDLTEALLARMIEEGGARENLAAIIPIIDRMAKEADPNSIQDVIAEVQTAAPYIEDANGILDDVFLLMLMQNPEPTIHDLAIRKFIARMDAIMQNGYKFLKEEYPIDEFYRYIIPFFRQLQTKSARTIKVEKWHTNITTQLEYLRTRLEAIDYFDTTVDGTQLPQMLRAATNANITDEERYGHIIQIARYLRALELKPSGIMERIAFDIKAVAEGKKGKTEGILASMPGYNDRSTVAPNTEGDIMAEPSSNTEDTEDSPSSAPTVQEDTSAPQNNGTAEFFAASMPDKSRYWPEVTSATGSVWCGDQYGRPKNLQ